MVIDSNWVIGCERAFWGPEFEKPFIFLRFLCPQNIHICSYFEDRGWGGGGGFWLFCYLLLDFFADLW